MIVSQEIWEKVVIAVAEIWEKSGVCSSRDKGEKW
jgi:hypothetical protein